MCPHRQDQLRTTHVYVRLLQGDLLRCLKYLNMFQVSIIIIIQPFDSVCQLPECAIVFRDERPGRNRRELTPQLVHSMALSFILLSIEVHVPLGICSIRALLPYMFMIAHVLKVDLGC